MPPAWAILPRAGATDGTTDWVFAGACADGEPFALAGQRVWAEPWTDTGETAAVLDPIYGVVKQFGVWTIGDPPLRFAAGEFSNAVWGFYLPANG